MTDTRAQRLGWILWPSFLVACAAELLFFALVDPSELQLFGRPLAAGRTAAYTAGFFAFWGIGAVSSALTLWLARAGFEVRSGTAPADERPVELPPAKGA